MDQTLTGPIDLSMTGPIALTGPIDLVLSGTPVEIAISEMLEDPRHVLVYEPEQEHTAHEVMEGVVAALVEEVQHSNPSLDNLIVLDSSREQHWEEISPSLEVGSLQLLNEGEVHIDRTSLIVAFGNGFLRSSILQPFATKATRFYAAVRSGAQTAAQVERVHAFERAVLLP